MAFVEDLAPFFADFGEDGTLAGQPVRGIFDSPYSFAALGSAGQSSTDPQFQLPTVQVPASVYGALLVLASGTFRVREHKPDGTGLSVLMLEKTS